MNKILVIIDSSGSMREWGKKDLLIYLVNTIKNYIIDEKFKNFEFEYYSWGEQVVKMNDFNSIETKGKSNISNLHNFVINNDGKILLLSDGNFEPNKKIDFKEKNILSISVGCDSHRTNLRLLLSPKKTYDTDCILQAINILCFGGE